MNHEAKQEGASLSVLAREANRLTLDRIPAAIQRQAALCVLDTLGCIVAGTRTAEARLILDCVPAEPGPTPCTVPGTAERRGVGAAIRINGYLGDVLELNDLIGGHASIGNVTAALALAESRGASGAALLEAVVRGIEVTTRVYGAVYPSLRRFTEMGLVPVGIPSSIGSAAAAARLLDLDDAQTAHAMAIAGAMAGWCPAEVIFGDGGTMKPLLFGAQPGETGVTAALYAQRGMTGPLRLLESKLGYFATAADAPKLDLAPWTDQWALGQPRRKLHACCGYLHSAVDAMGKLRQRLDAGQQARGRFDVHIPGYTADTVSKSRPPISPNDARFHLQYCLALALCGADVIRPEHSIEVEAGLARPEVVDAMARIQVVVDPALTHYHQCKVVVRDGGTVRDQESLSAPRGSPSEPLTDAQVVEKFVRLAGPVIRPAVLDDFANRASSLASVGSVADWLRALSLA